MAEEIISDDEILEWLNNCPRQWFLDSNTEHILTITLKKKKNA